MDTDLEKTGLPFDFDRLSVERSLGAHVQPKLTVHGLDDLWEREADANADAVVRASGDRNQPAELRFTSLVGPTQPDTSSGQIQRQEEEEEEELLQAKLADGGERRLGTETRDQIRALRGGGRSLPAGLRSELEVRFGCDFERVRIHTESKAAEAAGRIGARAFTTGHDVVFAPGEYRPESREGQRLLAHELTHVVQQTRTGTSPPSGGVVQRKSAAVPSTPRKALDTALKGDDDDVRDLVGSKVWPGLDVSAVESARLMENLLVGATVTDDEKAGLEVLTKARVKDRFDGTLEELDNRSRFRQLLDDYHGAEYAKLLTVLSKAIKKRKVKALYLDAFIAMWWLNRNEEEAVVILLERKPDADVVALLNENNRLAELRSDVEHDDLVKRFEKRVEVGNVREFNALRKKLLGLFRIKARKAVGRKVPSGATIRQEDVDRLLTAAAADLTALLLDYQTQITSAVDAGDIAKVRKINTYFEARFKHMLERKQREFNLELKYNLEFNRLIDDTYGRDWTVDDLDLFDKMLEKIPPEILYANPDFKGFRRGQWHPKKGGHASSQTNFIALFGRLKKKQGTTAHEVGHMVHFAADDAYKDFRKISKWQPLTKIDLIDLPVTEGIPKNIDDTLEEHRKSEDRDAFFNHGRFNYRYDRYGGVGQYWRYLADANFVSDYAKTDPQDDFAETFEAYLIEPEEGKKKAPKKYDFMHLRIFVEFWLEQQKKRTEEQLGRLATELAKKIDDSDFAQTVRSSFWSKISKSMSKKFDALRAMKVSLVKAGALKTPVPLKGSPEASKIKAEHEQKTRNLYALGTKLGKRLKRFIVDAGIFSLLVPEKLRSGFEQVSKKLTERFRTTLAKILKSPFKRIRKGEEVASEPWPELVKAGNRYDRALHLLDGYLKYYDRLESVRKRWKISQLLPLDRFGDFDPLAAKLIGRFPKDSWKYTKLGEAIDTERGELSDGLDDLERELIDALLAGKEWRKGVLAEPSTLARAYRSKILRHYGRVRRSKAAPKKPVDPEKGGRPQWF